MPVMIEFQLIPSEGGQTVAVVANQVDRIREISPPPDAVTEIIVGGITFNVPRKFSFVKTLIETQLT